MRGQRRHTLNRNGLPRRELERAIFIPLRTRSSISALNLPTSQQDSTRLNNLIATNLNDDIRRLDASRSGSNRPRINVSSFFMELTYSAGEPGGLHILKNCKEGQKRRLLEIHAANTMNIIKHYCPAKPHKLNQFRCCVRVERDDTFNFRNVTDKPLDLLDATQIKCNIKVLVLIRDDPSGKWNNSFTPYLINFLCKKHMNPMCITFQSEAFLNTLVEQLNDDLHVFPRSNNANDSTFLGQAKTFIIMSTLAKLVENWSVPLLVLDSCLSKLIDFNEIVEFCKRFEIKLVDVDANTYSGANKQRRAATKRIRQEIRTALTVSNLRRIGGDLKRLQRKLSTKGIEPAKKLSDFSKINSTLISDDCKRIVFSLHQRMNASLQRERESTFQTNSKPHISLLEDGILTDIENSDAFKYSRNLQTPNSSRTGRTYIKSACGFEDGRPKTSPSLSDEDNMAVANFKGMKTDFSTALIREREKISELLFNELNQRWRVHGPQRFIPKAADAGPYCGAMTDSEKQLLLTILQEVTYFETLKDIRNELKDSKKDLEGRLYGYNPDFANLIASAEEFLHGKASCMEPCKDEIQFYKLPVSLVMSDAEVKYLRSKPPTYVVGQESPNHLVKTAIEESTKLFMDAVIRTTCGTRKLSRSRRSKTKVIIVIEDNNEALELLAVALWFFEKTPLATFQTKYYYNTSDFLLSLDACRLYFRSYPAHTSKKDEERVFERWLGVGMNGILRSLEHKILLIDFPRPGVHLQNSKNILINRLKMEKKLNNIKSFIIGKPTRKEDNLSTVEKLLDEIQKVLEPRDKLLFRKSRRMYMDLKLYKQIEQKSRQDLKALRDWGLPEPENEHELWEKLRNSNLVINDVLPCRGAPINEPIETLTACPESAENTSFCEEDISEPESLSVDKSEESKKSFSEDANFLSECEESMESNTLREDHAALDDEVHPYFITLQMHANRSNSFGKMSTNDTSASAEMGFGNSAKEDLDTPVTSIRQIESANTDASVTGYILDNTESSVSASQTNKDKENSLNPSNSSVFGTQTRVSIDSNGLQVGDCNCSQSKKEKKRKYSIMDSEIQTEAFTKLEFTLPPDEDHSSCPTTSPRDKHNAETNEIVRSCVEEINSLKCNSQTSIAGRKSLKILNRKNLPELCVAYMSKWGKSLSRTLHKRTQRKRKFPEHMQFSKRSELQLPNSDYQHNYSNDDATKTGDGGVTQRIKVNNDVSDKKSERASHAWFRNFLGHFRVKASKKPMQRQTKFKK